MKIFVVYLILLALCDLSLTTGVTKNDLSNTVKKDWEEKLCVIMSISASKFYQVATKGKAAMDEIDIIYNKCATLMRGAIDAGVPPEALQKIVRMYGPQSHNIDKVYFLNDIGKLFTLIGNWEPTMIISFLYCTNDVQNRGELATQAATYADASWWREILNNEHLVRIIKTTLKLQKIIARTSYKTAFKYYMDVVSKNEQNQRNFQSCSEPVVMAILEFSARREIVIEEETLHLLFEAGCDMCPKSVDRRCSNLIIRDWADLHMALSDDNFIRAPRLIVHEFLRFRGKTTLSRMGLIPFIISEITKCKGLICVENTMRIVLFASENNFDLDVLKVVLSKAEQDGTRLEKMHSFFTELYAKEVDGKGADRTRTFFSNWDDKLVAFFFFLCDSLENSLNSLAKYKKFMFDAIRAGWTKESVIDFIYRSQNIKLFSTQYVNFFHVLKVSDCSKIFDILELLEMSKKEINFMWFDIWKKNVPLDVDKLTNLAKRSSQLKQAVSNYITNPRIKACDEKTIESIGNYVSLTEREGATAADYYDLFGAACTSDGERSRDIIQKVIEMKMSRQELIAGLQYVGRSESTRPESTP